MKRPLPACLMVLGVGVILFGSAQPAFMDVGARPYAFISLMALGAMMFIVGALLWSDS